MKDQSKIKISIISVIYTAALITTFVCIFRSSTFSEAWLALHIWLMVFLAIPVTGHDAAQNAENQSLTTGFKHYTTVDALCQLIAVAFIMDKSPELACMAAASASFFHLVYGISQKRPASSNVLSLLNIAWMMGFSYSACQLNWFTLAFGLGLLISYTYTVFIKRGVKLRDGYRWL